MHKIDENISDNSLNKSVARSSSGVSTQQSVEGLDSREVGECQIVYGNCFSKFPYPEIQNEELKRNSTINLDDYNYENYNLNDGTNTVDRRHSLKSIINKARRNSESHSKTLGKVKNSEIKRKTDSLSESANSNNLNRLLGTLTSLQENKSPCYYNENNNTFFRNPSISNPGGPLQQSISSNQTNPEPVRWKSLEDALTTRSETNPKDLFFAILDSSCKVQSYNTLTYLKLYQRAVRVCYQLTTKLTTQTGHPANVRPGQSVALMFSSDDPIDFIVAFYACVLSKIIAVPIDKMDFQSPGCSVTAKYLTQLSINTVLINSNTMKEVTRKGGDIRECIGWTDMVWVPIDSFYNEKPSKSFNIPESCSSFVPPLYVESQYSEKDNIYRGLPVTSKAALSHAHALEFTCNYKVGQSLLCSDDIRRQTGLWHAVITSLYSGLCCYYLPYSFIRKSPICWLTTLSKLKVDNVVANSRVLHHSLNIDTKYLSNNNLGHVKNVLISDASVPWISETIHQFIVKYVPLTDLPASAVLSSVSGGVVMTICTNRQFRPSLNSSDQPTKSNNHTTSVKLCQESLSYGFIKELSNSDANEDANQPGVDLITNGHLLPGVRAVVANTESADRLCVEEELGEICVLSDFSNRTYWMTPDEVSRSLLTVVINNEVSGDGSGDKEGNEIVYTRTGLVGFFRNIDGDDHVFIYGSLSNFVEINGRKFNSDDIIGTVSAVKPSGVLYKGRCCIFPVPVLNNNHLTIAVEVDPLHNGPAKVYTWISNVLQAILHLHRLNVYCVFALPPNHFPKSLMGDIHVHDTCSRFIQSQLAISHLTLCPQTALPNIAQLARRSCSSPVANGHLQMSLLAHALNSNSFASISGYPPIPPPELTDVDEEQEEQQHNETSTVAPRIMSLPEILEWRATHTPDHPVLSIIGPKLTVTHNINCETLYKKAEKVASYIKDKIRPNSIGCVIAIMVSSPIELLYSFYGCYYAGAIPLVFSVPCKEAIEFPLIIREIYWACYQSKAQLTIVSGAVLKLLKSKECNQHVSVLSWPSPVDINECCKRKPSGSLYTVNNIDREIGLMRYHIDNDKSNNISSNSSSTNTTSGLATLPTWTHSTISSLCDAFKTTNQLGPLSKLNVAFIEQSNSSLTTAASISNTSIFLHCLANIYCGYHAYVMSPFVIDNSPELWLDFLLINSIPHIFCDEKALKLVGTLIKSFNNPDNTKKGASLAQLGNFTVCVRDRPNQAVVQDFLNILDRKQINLTNTSIAIESYLTPGILLQTPFNEYPYSICLDRISLRNNRVVESQDSVQSTEVTSVGLPLSEGISIVVLDTSSRCQKTYDQIGELWLSSSGSNNFYGAALVNTHMEQMYRQYHDQLDQLCLDSDSLEAVVQDRLYATMKMGQSIEQQFVRTGLMGFIRSFGSQHHVVVLGKTDEFISIRGFSYFPFELEQCIIDVDDKFIGKCVTFVEADLLIIIIQLTKQASFLSSTPAQQQTTSNNAITEYCLRLIPKLVKTFIEQTLVSPAIIKFINYGQLSNRIMNHHRRIIRSLWLKGRLDSSLLQFYCL